MTYLLIRGQQDDNGIAQKEYYFDSRVEAMENYNSLVAELLSYETNKSLIKHSDIDVDTLANTGLYFYLYEDRKKENKYFVTLEII